MLLAFQYKYITFGVMITTKIIQTLEGQESAR